MKQLLLFSFFLISAFGLSQTGIDQKDLARVTRKLDSLNIDYKSETNLLVNEKKEIVDLFNIYIYNGDYSKKSVANFTRQLNAAQKRLVFPSNIAPEKKAILVRDSYLNSTDLRIAAKMYGLLGAKMMQLANQHQKEYEDKILTFLRETNYSPSAFKKLSDDEKYKLLDDFENKKK